MKPTRSRGAGSLGSRRSATTRGFTLTELLAVIAIIGILLVFILVAAMDGLRSAEEKATQSLITKLENGLNDRLEALLQTSTDPNAAHTAIAWIYDGTPSTPIPTPRASVIAVIDYLKRELPDVFVVQAVTPDINYPLNFAANPYPLGNGNDFDFLLPLGVANPTFSEGIHGASYTAAAGLYKNINVGGVLYLPAGYDGVDNGGILG